MTRRHQSYRTTLPAATTARLTELQSRIRPHFLFNTLNSAIALVRKEPAKAESLLEDLSDRGMLDLSEVLVCGCGDACKCVNGCPDDGCGIPRKERDAK